MLSSSQLHLVYLTSRRYGYDRKVSHVPSSMLISMFNYSRIIREATAKSKDGRIDQSDFLNYSSSNSRYSLFTPMEAAIVFHFAGRGSGETRLTLLDFAQLLDARWKAPVDITDVKPHKEGLLNSFFHSSYNFMLGGLYT